MSLARPFVRGTSVLRTARLPMLLALLLALPSAAVAAAATASQNVNLRAGPAASYGVVGQLQKGDAVDVRQCEGTFCQIVAGGKTGWVSASYLTRDAVARPTPAPQVAAAMSTRPVPHIAADGTPLPAASPRGADAATAPPAPQMVAARPVTTPTPAAPSHKPAPVTVASTPPPVYRPAPPAVTDDMDDDGPAVDGPLPKVDIPGNAGASANIDDDADADLSPQGAPPGDDWGYRPGPAPRRNYADLGGAGSACFIDADGGPGFCLRQGEHIDAPARWAGRPLMLRNPDGLNVVVCTTDDRCRNFSRSGPVRVGDVPIATIGVAAPGY